MFDSQCGSGLLGPGFERSSFNELFRNLPKSKRLLLKFAR